MKRIALFAGLIAMGSVPAVAQSTIDFNAKGIVVLSDGDMEASALVDGKLLTDIAAKDQLTTIKFPAVRGTKGVGSSIIANSVIGNTKTMAVPTFGRLAFVLENKVRPADGTAEYKDILSEFPIGEKLYVVDISNLADPKAKFGFPVGKNPTSIDINKNELIISTSEAGKELVFIETAADGKPTRFLNLPAAIDSTTRIVDLSWHPSGDFIAFTLDNHEVGIYKVIREAGKLKNVDLLGKTIKVGSNPTFGSFSPDGKHYFIVDGKSVQGKGTEAGELLVVDFSMDGSAEHKIASQTNIGVNPGSFAISPDGSLLVAVNAAKSGSQWTEPGSGVGSSLNLFKIGADGTLSKVADYPFEGIYPRSVAFDKDGSNIAVTVFEYLEFGTGNGGVEFWTVTKGDTPALKKQDAKVSLGKGAHTVRVIP
ncbi:hypothetical protein CLV98_11064 [Dyadobacter jejuensis]|uniref:Lactonase family protein with 7-bladed beta-propeller n=1 Tax=Dyadobacter jejuensis TaxID=1082580 RepID=A0A316AGC3_9BACT|nr:WD40 repeat domain-containing protein [Dyadobacter jejuensis]PWJ56753.1 hypothetical protein CLV98_11064 [Dyadobacter jejuensis]